MMSTIRLVLSLTLQILVDALCTIRFNVKKKSYFLPTEYIDVSLWLSAIISLYSRN